MLYDAILNGARSIAFYGGNNPNCWTASDSQYGWNWSFWSSVLKPLLGEINSLSPLAPALVNPATTQTLPANDATTQAISRQGNSGDLWVIAARHGAGTAHVTIGGLPASGFHRHRLHRGAVDHRLQRLVHRRLLAVGRARLPLRSRRTAAAAPSDATAVLRRRRRRPRSRHVLGRACRRASRSATVSTSRSPWRTRAVSRRVSSQRCRRRRTSRSRDRRRIAARAALPALPFVCDLDFLGPPGTVRLAVTVTGPGPVVITASARARQTDTNPADNDATLRIEPAAALSPSPPSSAAKGVRQTVRRVPPGGTHSAARTGRTACSGSAAATSSTASAAPTRSWAASV